MFDTDFVNAKQLLKVNVLKGAADTINSKETMGKGQVDLRDLCVNHPGEDYEAWFPLGSDDWAEDDGPVGPRCLATALHCTTLHNSALHLVYCSRDEQVADFDEAVPQIGAVSTCTNIPLCGVRLL
jgi:hypothetical protein